MDSPDFDDSAPSEALELRVLHGPQAGSTLPIEPGQTYTLGTADTCEVLLAGTQLEAEHVALSADGEGIQVTLLEGKVTTIDRDEVGSGQVIGLGTVLRVGRVKLTIDSVDAPWPEDEVLEEPDAPAPPQETALAGEPSPGQAAAGEPAHTSPTTGKSTARSLLPPLLLGTAAMLLMGAAVAAWVTTNDGARLPTDGADLQAEGPAGAASAQKPVLDVAALSRTFPDSTLTATKGADGLWVLGGRISTEDGRRRLREVAANLPTVPEVRVMLDSERMAAVTQFIDKRRSAGTLELNLEQGAAGALRIVGASATREGVATLAEAARKELADAGPIDLAVLARPELAARFEERLRAAGLYPKFKIVRREPKLELNAVLAASEVRTWERMFQDFNRDYGSVLTIVAQVQSERETVEIHIETVVAGPFPYVVTLGGKRIAPGGTLEGRTLVAIRDGELLFSDGMRVRYGN